ncbi:unnamed protein product [Arabidopsis lyrata]|nr:unnamed protein product [Arabidopsis lyrata]
MGDVYVLIKCKAAGLENQITCLKYGLEGANAALKCIKEIAEKEDFSCKRVDQSGLKDAAMIFQKRHGWLFTQKIRLLIF